MTLVKKPCILVANITAIHQIVAKTFHSELQNGNRGKPSIGTSSGDPECLPNVIEIHPCLAAFFFFPRKSQGTSAICIVDIAYGRKT